MTETCRIEVIGKESQTTSDQRGKDDGNIAFGNHQSNGQHGQTADDGYPTGQPVQSVDQVDGVRASDDPQNRQRDGELAGIKHRIC